MVVRARNWEESQMGRYTQSLTDRRFSRRRAMQAGLGASAFAMAGLGGWTPARAQDSAAADVTGDFDWKRHDGTTIKVLLNEHPYSDALKANLQTFQDLTGITVQHDTFPETNYFDGELVEIVRLGEGVVLHGDAGQVLEGLQVGLEGVGIRM